MWDSPAYPVLNTRLRWARAAVHLRVPRVASFPVESVQGARPFPSCAGAVASAGRFLVWVGAPSALHGRVGAGECGGLVSPRRVLLGLSPACSSGARVFALAPELRARLGAGMSGQLPTCSPMPWAADGSDVPTLDERAAGFVRFTPIKACGRTAFFWTLKLLKSASVSSLHGTLEIAERACESIRRRVRRAVGRAAGCGCARVRSAQGAEDEGWRRPWAHRLGRRALCRACVSSAPSAGAPGDGVGLGATPGHPVPAVLRPCGQVS